MVLKVGSAKTGIVRIDDRGPVIAVAAPAEHGKANEELLRFIRKSFGLPREAVSLLKGGSARRKTLKIETRQSLSSLVSLLESGTRHG